MEQGVRLRPRPLFFWGCGGRQERQGGHIHFRHTGRALRLTANTPDAPILWSLNECAIARRSVFCATAKRLNLVDRKVVDVGCDRKVVDVGCDRKAVGLQNTGEADPEDV